MRGEPLFLNPGHLRETHLTLLHTMIRIRALQVLAVRDYSPKSEACMVVFEQLLSLPRLPSACCLRASSSCAACNHA
jgi:hypothetical protein